MVERAEGRLERRQQLASRGELLECLGRVGIGTQAARDEHAEPRVHRAVGLWPVDRDHTDVVEHGLAAVGDAAGEVDLELARQALRVRVAQEEFGRRLRPRADVEHLERARAGEVATGHVADRVAARLAARQIDRCQQAQELGRLLELHEVHLHVLASGEVRPAARVLVGEVSEHLELLGDERAVGDLDPHHLVVPWFSRKTRKTSSSISPARYCWTPSSNLTSSSSMTGSRGRVDSVLTSMAMSSSRGGGSQKTQCSGRI